MTEQQQQQQQEDEEGIVVVSGTATTTGSVYMVDGDGGGSGSTTYDDVASGRFPPSTILSSTNTSASIIDSRSLVASDYDDGYSVPPAHAISSTRTLPIVGVGVGGRTHNVGSRLDYLDDDDNNKNDDDDDDNDKLNNHTLNKHRLPFAKRPNAVHDQVRDTILAHSRSSSLLLSPSNISTALDNTTSSFNSSALSLNKLRFSRLDRSDNVLHGREKEQQLLRRCIGRVLDNNNNNSNNERKSKQGDDDDEEEEWMMGPSCQQRQREVILIGGVSGVGKTRLARMLKGHPRMQRQQQQDPQRLGRGPRPGRKRGLYVHGKFDRRSNRNHPYSGLAAACRELCGEIQKAMDQQQQQGTTKSSCCSQEWEDRAATHPQSTTIDTSRSSSTTHTYAVHQTIGDAIVSDIGPELPLLMSVVPEIQEVVGSAAGTTADDPLSFGKEEHSYHHRAMNLTMNDGDQKQSHNDPEKSKNRLNNAFIRFFRVAATYFLPLVVVLDDLQWADQASLELIQVLSTDRQNPNMIVVGVYRSDEVFVKESSSQSHGGSCCFGNTIDWFRAKAAKNMKNNTTSDDDEDDHDGGDDGDGSICLTEIHIDEIDVSAVNKILNDLLCPIDADDTMELAEICHRRTNGNAFFLMKFLSMIHEEGLLTFNFGVMQWVFNVSDIETFTAATANVVEMMKDRMNELPPEATQLLIVASCLGSSFEGSVIRRAWARDETGKKDRQPEEDMDVELERMLGGLVDEGFLEMHGSSGYQFIHDKVQEAASSLVPQSTLNSMQFEMGRRFVATLTDEELESSLFMVVDLLNIGPSNHTQNNFDVPTRIEIASLNLKAAKKAVELSAFQTAANFSEKGIALLPPSGIKWSNPQYHELTLDLLSTAAEVQSGLGYVDRMMIHCHDVLRQDSVPLHDKFRVYNALLDSMANRGHMAEAIDLCFSILRKTNCTFPKRSGFVMVATLAGIRRLQAKMKKLTSDDISNLPLMHDKRRREVMKLMNKLVVYCYVGSHSALAIVTIRTVEWTLKYGVCESSPEAFLNTGVILTGILSDLECGARFSKYAALMFEKQRCRAIEARVTYMQAYLAPWTTPYRRILKPCYEAYVTCMRTGDTESAAWSMVHHVYFGFFAGVSLQSLDADSHAYVAQMLDIKRDEQSFFGKLLWQLILNLLGKSDEALILTGKAINQDEILRLATQPENRKLIPLLQAHQTLLYTYLGEHKLGAELALAKLDSYGTTFPGGPLVVPDMFLRAVSLYAIGRETGRVGLNKYCRQASKLHSKIASFVSKGNSNAIHYLSILNAEKAALTGKHRLARKRYEDAVVSCARSGFVHDSALANERYGEYLLYDLDDRDEASHRLKEAIRFYSEWGSARKVELIRTKHNKLWSVPAEIVMS